MFSFSLSLYMFWIRKLCNEKMPNFCLCMNFLYEFDPKSVSHTFKIKIKSHQTFSFEGDFSCVTQCKMFYLPLCD